MKRRRQLSEKQLGYLMILPSLILVILVILWPVTQSFWNSLFDYRLNDPARSQKMLNAHIDMERYVNDQYYIPNQLESLENNTSNGEIQDTIEQIRTGINDYHEELVSDPEVAEKVDTINEMLNNYEPVNDPDLKYLQVDNDFANEYRDTLAGYEEELQQLSETSDNQAEALSQASELIGSTKESILKSNFIGLKNYGKYLQDPRMWGAMWNTTVFTVVSVFFELIIGLCVALAINRAFKARGLFRASVLIPWAIPTAVSAMMWGFLYDGQSGIVAHYFANIFHIIPDDSWLLSTSDGAMFSVIFADIWKTTPYMALLILAGLQTIPGSLYEASEVDGAGKIQQFFKITLPLLKSAILVALLFRTLDAFRVFDLIYVLTGGGPANGTESISIYAYKTLFAQQNFGEGSVLSVLVFLAVALISVLYVKLIGSDLFEGRTK
nr:sugar ABC transporter permease [Sediminibacillus massiliensis]